MLTAGTYPTRLATELGFAYRGNTQLSLQMAHQGLRRPTSRRGLWPAGGDAQAISLLEQRSDRKCPSRPQYRADAPGSARIEPGSPVLLQEGDGSRRGTGEGRLGTHQLHRPGEAAQGTARRHRSQEGGCCRSQGHRLHPEVRRRQHGECYLVVGLTWAFEQCRRGAVRQLHPTAEEAVRGQRIYSGSRRPTAVSWLV